MKETILSIYILDIVCVSRVRCLWTAATKGLIHPPGGAWIWRAMVEWYWRENRRTRRACPIVTLCTTNPTWTELSANPGLCGDRLVTNRLSHGTACILLSLYSAVLLKMYMEVCCTRKVETGVGSAARKKLRNPVLKVFVSRMEFNVMTWCSIYLPSDFMTDWQIIVSGY
jgi:hypothetical protein